MNILVPFLSTELGRTAVRAAVDEATMRGGTLRLVGHVRVSNSDAGDQVRVLRAALERTAAELRERGIDCEDSWSVGPQTLSARVLGAAADWPADLIVMGYRKRSRVGKLVLGSYEQSILLHADCPVLAVLADPSHLRASEGIVEP